MMCSLAGSGVVTGARVVVVVVGATTVMVPVMKSGWMMQKYG